MTSTINHLVLSVGLALGLLVYAGQSHADEDQDSLSHSVLIEEIDLRFEPLLERMHAVEGRLWDMLTRDESHDHHDDAHAELLAELDTRFEALHERLSELEARLREINALPEKSHSEQ